VSTISTLRGHDTIQRISIALALFGCGGDLTSSDAQGRLSVPSRADFPVVADSMQLSCGTLDCHGQVGRNMRLYGRYGLRLDPTYDPLTEQTSDAEYDATFASVVGLEPEAMSNVVRHLASPDALTMIRKARGIEDHKGGKLVTAGDPLDSCIVGWLTGGLDAGACNAVVNAPRPEPPRTTPDGG
jgi:hypothetical protein